MRLQPATEPPPPGLEEMLRELGAGDRGFGGTSFGRGEADLPGFLRACADGEDPAKVTPGFVPQTVYWMIDDAEQVVGMLRLRHHLNDHLLQHGGHVGYYVRPAARGKDRKSTRLNSSHPVISYAVFCLKNKTECPADAAE